MYSRAMSDNVLDSRHRDRDADFRPGENGRPDSSSELHLSGPLTQFDQMILG
jgi:hypothetical protein